MKKKICLLLCLSFIFSFMPLAVNAEIKYDIKPQYEDARDFSEGLAAVKKNGKWGFINKKNSVVIQFQYDNVDHDGFHEGLAGVKIGSKYGFIDKNGNVVITPQYEYIANGFNEAGLAGVSDIDLDKAGGFFGDIEQIDKCGNRLSFEGQEDTVFTQYSEGLRAIKREGKIGFENDAGKVVIQPKYDEVRGFKFGVAAVAVKENDELRWGVADKAGNEIVPLQHSWPPKFREGLAALSDGNHKWGYIDNAGKIVIPMIYEYFSDFQEGMAVVKRSVEDEYNFIDKTGQTLFSVPGSYSFNLETIGDLVSAQKDELCGLLDKSGSVVVPFEFDSFSQYSSDYIIGRKSSDSRYTYTLFDKDGKVIIPPIYDEITEVGNVFRVNKGEKIGIVDKSGKEIIKPLYDSFREVTPTTQLFECDYDNKNMKNDRQVLLDIQKGKVLRTFNYFFTEDRGEGVSFVVENNKFGCMDKNGNLLIPFSSNVEIFGWFYEGLAQASKNHRVGFVDTSGKVAIKYQFDGAWNFLNGLAAIEMSGKWGFIDKSGRVVIKPKYDLVKLFYDKVTKVKIGDKCGLINRQGVEILKPVYDEIIYTDDTVIVKKNGKYGVFDASGKEVIALQDAEIQENSRGGYPYLFSEGMIKIKLNGKYGFASEPAADKAAEKQLTEAIEAKLIPESMLGNYKIPMIQNDFYKLCAALYEKQQGKNILEILVEKNMDIGDCPFQMSRKAQAAWRLGIVEASLVGTLYDYKKITRDEAAVVLANTAKVLGKDISAPASNCTDRKSIAVSAQKAVDFVISKGIMSPAGKNRFDPKGTLTRQEAFVAILKLYKLL